MDATREASTEAFRLAMGIAAGLFLAGAGVNAVGVRNPDRELEAAEAIAVAGETTSRLPTC